jgi:opine dehydrogenase
LKIAVIGGGNGCYAAAADLSEQGHEVRLWRRDEGALAPVLEIGGIVLLDSGGSREVPLALATAELGEALAGAELVLAPLPATAQANLAERLAPELSDGQVVFLPPGTFGSYVMARAMRQAGNGANVAFAEAGTLPWLARKRGPREVAVSARATRGLGARLFRSGGRLSRGRAAQRRARRGADERRPDHPSTADPDECRAAAAFRRLGHPQ